MGEVGLYHITHDVFDITNLEKQVQIKLPRWAWISNS